MSHLIFIPLFMLFSTVVFSAVLFSSEIVYLMTVLSFDIIYDYSFAGEISIMCKVHQDT